MSSKPDLVMPLGALLRHFGMTMPDLLPDLEAGNIIATGSPAAESDWNHLENWRDVYFTKSEVERWMLITGRKPKGQ